MYADLASLVADSGLLGFGEAVDLDAYRSVFPRNLEDQPFSLCFGDVIRECAECGYLSVPRENVEFMFDRNFDIEFNATYLYDYMTKCSEWQAAQCLFEKLSFTTRKTVGIQAADLVARETMKHLDNQVGPISRPTRISMRRLSDTGRFRFHFYNREGIEYLREQAADLSKPGSKMSEYLAWIVKMKLADNTSSRLRYLKRLTETSPN